MDDSKEKRERIFVFKRKLKDENRPYLIAIPESKINILETQDGSQNVYLKINNIVVDASFNDLISKLGERVDID
jgi:hypothetical protein